MIIYITDETMVVMVTTTIKELLIIINSLTSLNSLIVNKHVIIVNKICRKVLILLTKIGLRFTLKSNTAPSKYDPDIRSSLNTINIIKYNGIKNLMPKIKYIDTIKTLSAIASK